MTTNTTEKYKLTPEHEAQLEPWKQKWIANTLSTEAMTEEDRAEMRRAIKGLYSIEETVNKDPIVVFCSSPITTRIAAGFAAAIYFLREEKEPIPDIEAAYPKLRNDSEREIWRATMEAIGSDPQPIIDRFPEVQTIESTEDPSLATTWYCRHPKVKELSEIMGLGELGVEFAYAAWRFWQGGNQWSGTVAFLTFFRYVVGLPLDYSLWDHWEKAAIHGGPRCMHQDFCIVSDRPELLTVDESNRPHNETGPFCRWRDGFSLYTWHGIRVPAWVIEHREKVTKETILGERNVETRRVYCEIVGYDKVIEMLGATLIAEDESLGQSRELFDIQLGDDDIARVVRVRNGTLEPDGTRREFFLGVDRGCKTPAEAVAWSYGLKKPLPEVLRT